MSDIEDYLKGMSSLHESRCYESYALESGRLMIGEFALPEGVKRGEKKNCFANAYRLAMARDWTYVEGWAANIIPMHHAWCLDDEGRLVDPTWDFEPGREYFGVDFDLEYVCVVLVKSGTFGVLYKPESFDLLLSNPGGNNDAPSLS